MRFQLLLYRQDFLGTMQCVDDILVTTSDREERPRVCDDHERQTVVENVEQVLFFNLQLTRTVTSRHTYIWTLSVKTTV